MVLNLKNIRLNYEVAGSGKPLIMLHGNNESLEIFRDVFNYFKKDYQVYLIDSRCHGLSDNGPLSYDLMKADLIEFIKLLKINTPIVYGFSDGGIVALMAALEDESLFEKLILSGINIYPKMFDKETLESILKHNLEHPNIYDHLMLNEPNLNLSCLNKLTLKINLIAGEYDCILKKHTKLIHDNLYNSTLEVLENETHDSYVYNNQKLINILSKYL